MSDSTTPKTSTERAQDRKRRLRADGFKELRNLWVRIKHEEQIRAFAEALEEAEKKMEQAKKKP